MAKSQNVDIYKTIKRYNPRTGKTVKTQVKVGSKSTNVAKGGNTTLRSDASKLEAQRIAEKGQTARTKIAARSADITNIAAQLGTTIRQGLGSGSSSGASTAQKLTSTSDAGVDQNVNGGITSGSNSRDDDDSDSPWVD